MQQLELLGDLETAGVRAVNIRTKLAKSIDPSVLQAIFLHYYRPVAAYGSLIV